MPAYTAPAQLHQSTRLEVQWARFGPVPRVWHALQSLDLDSINDAAGVYVIWHEGKPSRIVAVGQTTSIKHRVASYRSKNEILAYNKFGTLRVTWAAVSHENRDGVEKYLVDLLTPLVGVAPPDVPAIAVNW